MRVKPDRFAFGYYVLPIVNRSAAADRRSCAERRAWREECWRIKKNDNAPPVKCE